MHHSLLLLPALAAFALAQSGTGTDNHRYEHYRSIIATAVPSSIQAAAASSVDQLTSEFMVGSATTPPPWFAALQSDVQEYIIPGINAYYSSQANAVVNGTIASSTRHTTTVTVYAGAASGNATAGNSTAVVATTSSSRRSTSRSSTKSTEPATTSSAEQSSPASSAAAASSPSSTGKSFAVGLESLPVAGITIVAGVVGLLAL
ncbi:hypothetical protein K470DRAFT_263425 [Piedraia hortae CBS 480.64]|uniref:Uncharacterized protein n=1 Tax=Piedraia hortae CBS 480.64 TaxID=1314780 RepID=A0A6A7C4Z4_9PEZI|nr:hypothetical protein K470DRAFT_263425 [Piedraia hortae CBS 480.64]